MSEREMTLLEWMDRLPPIHLARREFQDVIAENAALKARLAGTEARHRRVMSVIRPFCAKYTPDLLAEFDAAAADSAPAVTCDHFPGQAVCEWCKGTGAIDAPTSADDPSCPECDGEGYGNTFDNASLWSERERDQATKIDKLEEQLEECLSLLVVMPDHGLSAYDLEVWRKRRTALLIAIGPEIIRWLR